MNGYAIDFTGRIAAIKLTEFIPELAGFLAELKEEEPQLTTPEPLTDLPPIRFGPPPPPDFGPR